jgi:SepF-like predicted cell division protein (DUF552 family)
MTEHVSKVYVGEDLARLKQLINDGVAVMNEIETLKGGLSDTVKNVAEELDIKAAQLNKAIKVAYKNNLGEEKDKLAEIEDILDAVGI